ncbi:SMR family transporter [Aneurinibacillus thermoaerophilus]|nr:SMR family transporter [Aneurinibacillus thermoaerophilus]
MKYGTLSSFSENEAIISRLIKHLTNIPILFGLFLYGLSALFWIFAISKVQLSYAYPMVAIGYVFVFVFSVLLFNESISNLRIVGLLTIIIGIMIIAKS